MKKQLVQFVNQCTIVLPEETHFTLVYNSSLCVLPVSSYRIFSRHVRNSPFLIKLIMFTDSSRAFLSETYFFWLVHFGEEYTDP